MQHYRFTSFLHDSTFTILYTIYSNNCGGGVNETIYTLYCHAYGFDRHLLSLQSTIGFGSAAALVRVSLYLVFYRMRQNKKQ